MSFKINIKNKSFINKHDRTKVEVLKNIKIEIQSKEFVCIADDLFVAAHSVFIIRVREELCICSSFSLLKYR